MAASHFLTDKISVVQVGFLTAIAVLMTNPAKSAVALGAPQNGLFDCYFRPLLWLTRQMLNACVQHLPECLKKLNA